MCKHETAFLVRKGKHNGKQYCYLLCCRCKRGVVKVKDGNKFTNVEPVKFFGEQQNGLG